MILAAAFRVLHSRLGPGLLESVYQRVLAYELTKGGLSAEVQKSIPIGPAQNSGKADSAI